MLGFEETDERIHRDDKGFIIAVIFRQYLRQTDNHLSIVEYVVTPYTFDKYLVVAGEVKF